MLTTPQGKIQFTDPTAQRWLRQFFGRAARPGALPRKLCRWLAVHHDRASATSAVDKEQNARLFVKKDKPFTETSALLLLELIKNKGGEQSRRHRALTRRENQVLLWLTRGKSNAEISEILGISPATVSKHLERIYPKLGVENRTAAANFNLQDRQLLN